MMIYLRHPWYTHIYIYYDCTKSSLLLRPCLLTMSLTAAGVIGQRAAPESEKAPSEKALSTSDEKSFDRPGDIETATIDVDSEEGVLSNERDIATHVISVDDDPTLNPWTFRAFFIGLGLSAFGGVLGKLL